MTNRACIACGEIYNGPLACPACGEPGEPLHEIPRDPSPQEQALIKVLALTFQGIRLRARQDAHRVARWESGPGGLDHYPLRETSQTITIERPDMAVTVGVSGGAVVDALDEWGAPVALTPSETAEALQRAADGSDESGI